MSFSIRRGEETDMESVLKLIVELAVYEKEPDAVHVQTEDLIKHGFKSPPAFWTFVAEREGEIVGVALFYNRFSTWDGPSIHLEDLIVTESCRGLGIGKALYDHVLKFAIDKGVERVEWNVIDWNAPAIKFYLGTGATMLADWNVVQMKSAAIKKYLGGNL